MRLVYLVAIAWTLTQLPLVISQDTSAARAQAEVAELDQRWQDAVVRGDANLIQAKTTEGFVFTHGGGRSDTKSDWVRIAKRVPQPFLERRVSNQSVELHGDVALVFGRLDVRSQSSQSVPNCYALNYVHLYVRQGGQWMFASHRTTQGVEPSPPCNKS